MENDPSLNGRYLGSISTDFVKVADQLKEASYMIRRKGFSDYPIFTICKEQQPIGQLLIEKGVNETSWHYFATFLDEFVQRNIMEEPESFQKAYKNPDEFCCLFVIDREFTNFVFLPYPEDSV